MLASLVLSLAQDPIPAFATRFDKVVALEIDAADPRLEGHGRRERVEYTSEFSGTLHVWTKVSGSLDLHLRVEDTDGKLVHEDDNSGGERTPYLTLLVAPGRRLVVFVAAATEAGIGKCELHLVAAPETAATLAEGAKARAEIGRIRRLREAKDLATARTSAEALVERLASLPGAGESEVIAQTLFGLGSLTFELSALSGTKRAWGHVHAYLARALPNEHPVSLGLRQNLGATLLRLGECETARALFQEVLEIRTRALPEEDPDVQVARSNLAAAMLPLGEFAAVRAIQERLLEVSTRTLPDSHPNLQVARGNLAATLNALGDFGAARMLQEKVLQVRSLTLSDEHPDLQVARGNLAATLYALGDFSGARVLDEKVLQVLSLTLPDDHPDLQHVRLNLSLVLRKLGDLAAARSMTEKVLEVRSRALPDEHPDLQRARRSLAVTMCQLGDLPGARVLQEKVLEVESRTLPREHPDLSQDRENLATILLEIVSRPHSVPPGASIGDARTGGPETQAALELLEALSRDQTHVAREVSFTAPGREAEERCARLARHLDFCLSASLGYGGLAGLQALQPTAFAYAEATRNASLSSAAETRRAANSPAYEAARRSLGSASTELARLAQSGTNTEAFRAALREREQAEKALLELSRALAEGRPSSADFDASTLSAALGPGDVLIAYRRFDRQDVRFTPATVDSTEPVLRRESRTPSLCAFVLRGLRSSDASAKPAGTSTDFVESPGRAGTGMSTAPGSVGAMLTLVDLGSIETIRAVFESWRQAVGIDMERGVGVEVPGADIVRERGDALRHLILDPVLAHAGDARRIVIVPDDVLHLVPFDALPAPREEGAAQASTNGDKRTPDPADVTAPSRTKASPRIELLGERLRVEMRLTAMELLEPAPAHSTANSLLAVGGASFNSEPLELEAEEVAPIEGAMVPRERSSTLLRGTRWERGFEPLPFTARESHSLAALHAEVFGPAGLARVLEARKASAAALKELAPRARWLHIATHGWFGPESIRSWEDTDPIDSKSGCVLRETGLEQVKGMCPMLLCGLALAGANLPENAVGRVPGLMTAEEVASLDLSNCELAVLSACDTARGELRRASQGVASLQKALQIAGARSVVTSLWKVPDEATKDLMLDFYRRVWVEKVPKWKALWEAKRKLRDAKDDAGRVKYTLRDWGAWVLTGRPE